MAAAQNKQWQQTRDTKQLNRANLIPSEFRIPSNHSVWKLRDGTKSDIVALKESGLLSDSDAKITGMSATELAQSIRSGEMSAVTITTVL